MPAEGDIEVDRRLLQRSAEGDREAFLQFMDRHQAALFRFCRSLSDRVEDAEDALQETFLAAWRHADGFRGSGSARSWLFTSARRHVYRAVRRERPEALGDTSDLEQLGVEAGWGEEGRTLANIDLAEAFDRLSTVDQQVLVLRELEGFSNAEAAEILGVELAAIKSRLHRARLRLMAAVTRGTDIVR
jgi:RNA polymerase sigma-70 factor (ECF subfamily)